MFDIVGYGLGSSCCWLGAESVLTGFDKPANRVLVISTAIVVALVVVLALVSRKKIGLISTGMGAIFEYIYEFVLGMANSMMGSVGERFVPFCMSIFLFVLISNWSGLLPVPAFEEVNAVTQQAESEPIFECPSANFNTTLAMAMVTFLAFNFYGLRKNICGTYEDSKGEGLIKGFGCWLMHFLHPTPNLWRDMQGVMRYCLVPILGCLFLVLNIIEEVARLISLSIRLYGNIFGEHTVKSNLYSNMQGFVNSGGASLTNGEVGGALGMYVIALLMWACSFFATCIGTLAGFIQAYVFFVLTLSYISHVATDEE